MDRYAILAMTGMGLLAVSCCRMQSFERESAIRRVEVLAREGYRIRVLKVAGEARTLLLESMDARVIQEWRTCLRVVPTLCPPPISYGEDEDPDVFIALTTGGCDCPTEYVVEFRQDETVPEEVVVEVGVVHVWDGTRLRCKEVNLGSDTPLLPEAARALREKLRALGERPPVWNELPAPYGNERE